jgi:L-arabinose isomerase
MSFNFCRHGSFAFKPALAGGSGSQALWLKDHFVHGSYHFCSFAQSVQTYIVCLTVMNLTALDQVSQKFRVGLFTIGLDTYWNQYNGLRERLEMSNATICRQLSAMNADVVNAGIVDTFDNAMAAGHFFRQQDVDLLFLHLGTYALSATVLPIVRRCKTPVIVLNLSPELAIDYERFNRLPDRTAMTGEWLAHCQSCTVPEIANVFSRCDIPFRQVTGVLSEERVWHEIGDWLEASRVAHDMEGNRLGIMGHYYTGMLDIYTDLTLQSSVFGTQFEMVEVDELSAFRREINGTKLSERVDTIREMFDVEPSCTPDELESAARTAIALDSLVAQHQLGSLAYYYKGAGIAENHESMSSVIVGTSMLTARGIPVAGELEIKNTQAMKILDLFGIGGSFTEFYASDYIDNVVLMGHDGPGHMAIAEGKPKLRPLNNYHGKVGRGLSIEMTVRHGPVTLLSVAEAGKGKLKFVVAEGESVPGPILEIGNTNSRYRFSIGARTFLEKWSAAGPAHHCAVGVGHNASRLSKLASLLDIEYVQIC